jgi:CHAT domain-containing protein
MRAAKLLSAAEIAAVEIGDERLLSYAQGYRGGLYVAADRLDEARMLTRRALLSADRVAAHDVLYRWHSQLSRIERRAGNGAAALAAARRAVDALSVARTDSSRVLDSAGARFEEEIEPVYLELVDLILERAKTQKGSSQQSLLTEARNTLEGLKAEEVRDYFEDACLTAQRKVAPDEVPGAAVLYPVLLSDRVELILGREGVLSHYTVEIGRKEIDQQARELRRSLPNRVSRVYLRSATSLYDALIRPIEKELAGAKVLVVIPSGQLRQIPFAALYDGQKHEYLIEKIAVATTPGLTLTDPRPLPATALQALAAGISEAVQGYSALPSVAVEIDTVSQTFSSVVLLNSDFTASRFEQTIARRPVSVVHIASHGEFRPESSESFVLTYDGKISMNRLAEAIGRTRLRAEEPLELLVLSACETAAGDDRSALGLAGVALHSGARSAIATLWYVSDEAAGTLISRFYREIGNGRSRADALRIAQLSLLNEHEFNHPVFWSPFLLISNWL